MAIKRNKIISPINLMSNVKLIINIMILYFLLQGNTHQNNIMLI